VIGHGHCIEELVTPVQVVLVLLLLLLTVVMMVAEFRGTGRQRQWTTKGAQGRRRADLSKVKGLHILQITQGIHGIIGVRSRTGTTSTSTSSSTTTAITIPTCRRR